MAARRRGGEPPFRELLALAACIAVAVAGDAVAASADGVELPPSSPPEEFDGLYWSRLDAPNFNKKQGRRHSRGWGKKIFKTRSTMQFIEVMHDDRRNATTLFLDRALQLTDVGEHMYHELMAHVPLQTLASPPRDVLIIGAGDGGVALRVLMHPSVERVVQVELDGEVVATAQKHFGNIARSFDDPRMELRIQDAIAWARQEANENPESFDACIIDSTDNPLVSIWSAEFYAALRRMIRPGGVLMQNIAGFEESGQMENMLRLRVQGGWPRTRAVVMATIDYEHPYIGFLSSDLSTPCPGPAADAAARAVPLRATWYSPEIHRASLVVPPALIRLFPNFGPGAEGCRDVFFDGAGRPSDARPAAAPPQPRAPAASAPRQSVRTVDVVVVGGGLAGSVAAHALALHLGVKDVLIVEAKDGIRGHLHATSPPDFGGASADVGEPWFPPSTAVERLATRLGCLLGEPAAAAAEASDRPRRVFAAEGLGPLPESAPEAAAEAGGDAAAQAARRLLGLAPPAGAAASAMEGRSAMECVLRGVLAEGRAQLSHGVVQSVAAGAAGGPLEVAYRGANGRLHEVRAKAVLVTVPLGVLQESVGADGETCSNPDCAGPGEGAVSFAPPVPAERAAAWRARPPERLLRVALLFEEQFWDNGTSTLAYLFRGAGDRAADDADAVVFTSLAGSLRRPALVAEVHGALAERLEAMADSDVAGFLLREALQPLLPAASVPVTAAAVVVKRFGSDPYLRGGLRPRGVFTEEEARQWGDSWSPLWGGRLHFAGAHAVAPRSPALQGALLSAVQSAWAVACAVSGGAPRLSTPVELVRLLGIFGDTLPHRERVRRCVAEFATAGWGAASGGSCGSPRWLEALEQRCAPMALGSTSPR